MVSEQCRIGRTSESDHAVLRMAGTESRNKLVSIESDSRGISNRQVLLHLYPHSENSLGVGVWLDAAAML